MSERTSPQVRQLFEQADIVGSEYQVTGSLFYLPHGQAIRSRILGVLHEETSALGYDEVHIPELVSTGDVDILNEITALKENYLHVVGGEKSLAASHEIAIYPFLKKHLQRNPNSLPIRWYNQGNAFRNPRNAPYPFNFGERASFFEGYGIFDDKEAVLAEEKRAIKWNQDIVFGKFHLPGVEVVRPFLTNKPFSRRTTCIDTVLPYGRTIITGMTYLHDDIFTGKYGVTNQEKDGSKTTPHSVHFGMSDNLMFSYLLNFQDKHGLVLSSVVAPYSVAIICSEEERSSERFTRVTKYLDSQRISYKVFAERNHKAINKQRSSCVLKGIPIQIIFSPQHNQSENVINLYSRYNDSNTETTHESFALETIDETIKNGDKYLMEKSKLKLKEQVESCDNVRDAKDIVKSGKVAEIIINGPDYNVKEIERDLNGGEVLGINTSEGINRLYIARRI